MCLIVLLLSIVVVTAESMQHENICVTPDFSMSKPNAVNVLNFLNPLWPYSDIQAYKLMKFANELQNSEIPKTSFFVILKYNPNANKEAGNITMHMIKDIILKNFTVIEDNEELQIWSKFEATRKHIFIIDKCGLIKQKFISVWGIPNFSRIQSAILKADQRSCICNRLAAVSYSEIEDDTN